MSLLANATYAAPGAPLYGSGGGGGGANPQVSSITLAPNGDINFSGSVNFQGLPGGGLSWLSTVSVLDGTTPASQLLLGAPNNTSEFILGIANDNKAFISTSAATLTWAGGDIDGLAQIAASNITISSINGAAIPTAGPVVTSQSATNPLVYAPPGGGNSPAILSFAATNGHSYKIEMPVKVQGWNSNDGNTSNYVPGIGDNLYISPSGNITGSPAPVFMQVQMAAVSSMNNDYETFVTGTVRTSATGTIAVFANTIGATYSTSVEVGTAPCYVWDLGAI